VIAAVDTAGLKVRFSAAIVPAGCAPASVTGAALRRRLMRDTLLSRLLRQSIKDSNAASLSRAASGWNARQLPSLQR
jgi:hypothetical protein